MHHPSCQQRQNPSGRVIKTLCLQVERAAPVTRTVSSTYNCDTGTFQSSKYRPSACKRSPQGPCIFVSCARSLQVSSYQQKQNSSGPVKKTLCLQSLQVSSCPQEENPSGFVIKHCVCRWGGLRPKSPSSFMQNQEPANQIPDGLGADTALPIAIPLLPNITCCTRKRNKSSCPKSLQQRKTLEVGRPQEFTWNFPNSFPRACCTRTRCKCKVSKSLLEVNTRKLDVPNSLQQKPLQMILPR